MQNNKEQLAVGIVKAPRQFAQLGLLVVDGSRSMQDITANGNNTKAQAANDAIRELFTRIKVSRTVRNFYFAIITFDEKVTVRLRPTQAGPNLDGKGNYDPTIGHGGSAKLYAALTKAELMANDFIAQAPIDGVKHSVVILVMSDGCCSDPANTRTIAKRIKNGPNGFLITICCAFFSGLGTDHAQGEELLKSIATDPVLGYKTVYDGNALRNFFLRSLSSTADGL